MSDDRRTWGEKHRDAAVELLEIADDRHNTRPIEALLPAVVHALLTVEDRLGMLVDDLRERA